VLPFRGVTPRIDATAFVAPGVTVIGDVVIGPDASVWFGSIVRGDVHHVRIGARTNLQDGTIVHVSRGGHPTLIGADVTVGHRCMLHACTLLDRAFVGMSATVLDGAVVESDAMLAAGALLTPGKRVPSGQLWAGRPARPLRDLTEAEIERARDRVRHYVELAREYRTAVCGTR
jgi:carbonic anhydrase/acetyltransferase-like protein (isoleucine patch superfamily)